MPQLVVTGVAHTCSLRSVEVTITELEECMYGGAGTNTQAKDGIESNTSGCVREYVGATEGVGLLTLSHKYNHMRHGRSLQAACTKCTPTIRCHVHVVRLSRKTHDSVLLSCMPAVRIGSTNGTRGQ
jgi:hypothetical protein